MGWSPWSRLGPGGACLPRGVAEDGSQESSGHLGGGCGCAGGPDAEAGEDDGHAGGSEASGRSPRGVSLREGVTCWERTVEAGCVRGAGRFSGLGAALCSQAPLSPGLLRSGSGWGRGACAALAARCSALCTGAQALLPCHLRSVCASACPQAGLPTGAAVCGELL